MEMFCQRNQDLIDEYNALNLEFERIQRMLVQIKCEIQFETAAAQYDTFETHTEKRVSKKTSRERSKEKCFVISSNDISEMLEEQNRPKSAILSEKDISEMVEQVQSERGRSPTIKSIKSQNESRSRNMSFNHTLTEISHHEQRDLDESSNEKLEILVDEKSFKDDLISDSESKTSTLQFSEDFE